MRGPREQRDAFAWALGWWIVRRVLERRAARLAVVAPRRRRGRGLSLVAGLVTGAAAIGGAAWLVRHRGGSGAA